MSYYDSVVNNYTIYGYYSPYILCNVVTMGINGAVLSGKRSM